ncbi:MAG: triose-phosphate isomerase [Candidatus Margulisbacteria bacterium]|nr:triose-phosphate isomerase [Candidatus Margulisiibacteriota bacterium]
MGKMIIAGNWKMNKDLDEAVQLVEKLKKGFKNKNKVEVVICPSFTNLSSVNEIVKDSDIMLGAQNMYTEEKGAYTGEISASMLKSVGCKYVIVGHSERRQYFNETNSFLNKKVKVALENNLIPIYCVGETLEQRESGKVEKVIKEQIEDGLKGVSLEDLKKVVVAYEPVWAIGTGKTATPQQANDVHFFIRKLLKAMANEAVADYISILYGGSVTPESCRELMSKSDIDGALVGGASLKADSFAEIINY